MADELTQKEQEALETVKKEQPSGFQKAYKAIDNTTIRWMIGLFAFIIIAIIAKWLSWVNAAIIGIIFLAILLFQGAKEILPSILNITQCWAIMKDYILDLQDEGGAPPGIASREFHRIEKKEGVPESYFIGISIYNKNTGQEKTFLGQVHCASGPLQGHVIRFAECDARFSGTGGTDTKYIPLRITDWQWEQDRRKYGSTGF